jgi:hypothetical protein
MPRYTRLILVLMALGFTGVFACALWIDPYDAEGRARTIRTHTQLGLPPCTAEVLLGKPCPACGMTTSFALLSRGDLLNSLRANWVGTLIAVLWLALIPWGIASAIRGRLWGIRNGELAVTIIVAIVLALMLARWLWIMVT